MKNGISHGGLVSRDLLERYRPSLMEIYESPRMHQMHRWHHYIPIYAQFFARFRDQPINMLEIGVQYGGGMEMWRQYMHPETRIHGVDINPNCARPPLPNSTVTNGDQADPEFWKDFLGRVGRLDIVIDDGGHTMNQQIVSFESIYHTMAADGLYVVEDTHTSVYGQEFYDRSVSDMTQTFMDFAHQMTWDLMEWSGQRSNFNALMQPDRSKLDGTVSEFCRTTQGIHFYDSMVVFERGKRSAPGHSLR